MATPIAHKGATAGAKVLAMTALDLYLNPAVLEQARAYFDDVQTADHEYTPFISDDDLPAIHLNEEIMAKYRDEMKTYYYDSDKYDTYLEQLGIDYPTVREEN
jgi:aminobenzoyl-glutamate utilization protein B